MSKAMHSIKAVSKRSGLSPHLIRMWERRYGVVEPERTESNRRVYTDDDIYRLTLLKRVVDEGESIGNIANLPNDELERIMRAASGGSSHVPLPEPENGAKPAEYIDQALEAIDNLDEHSLERVLSRASVSFGRTGALEKVIIPMLDVVGERWQEGTIRIANEHLASAVARTMIGGMTNGLGLPENAPHLVVTTPAGIAHEYGALAVAVIASTEGWSITYLGPNLPAEEIAGVAQAKNSRAVALSLVYPPDDPLVASELRKIRELLPDEAVLIVGGRSAKSYASTLSEIDARYADDLADLRGILRSILS